MSLLCGRRREGPVFRCPETGALLAGAERVGPGRDGWDGGPRLPVFPWTSPSPDRGGSTGTRWEAAEWARAWLDSACAAHLLCKEHHSPVLSPNVLKQEELGVGVS